MAWTSYNRHHQVPFWEFIHSLDPNHPSYAGVGVDHCQEPQAGPSFGPQFGPGYSFGPAGFHAWRGGWGHHHRGRRGGGEGFGPRTFRHGYRGRHCRRGGPPNPEDPPADQERDVNERAAENEKEDTPGTMRDDGPNPPNPPAADHPHNRPDGAASPPPPPPPPYGAGPHPFDFRAMMQAFANHPFAQQLREYVQNTRSGATGANNDYGDGTFVPPVDIFNTETHWTIHIGLPGAKKEDIGVNWDAEKSHLAVSGVVHRPGDEEFLQGLVSGERKIGMFERNVRLPPEGGNEKDEVDAEGITAKMEDGLLIVVVPKVEREWTEVRKVDIE